MFSNEKFRTRLLRRLMKPVDEKDAQKLIDFYPVLQHFEYKHLPPNLRVISAQFHDLAWGTASNRPIDPEIIKCLDKLLEAKDCAVRAERMRPKGTTT